MIFFFLHSGSLTPCQKLNRSASMSMLLLYSHRKALGMYSQRHFFSTNKNIYRNTIVQEGVAEKHLKGKVFN